MDLPNDCLNHFAYYRLRLLLVQCLVECAATMKKLLLIPLAIILIIEEWLWDFFSAMGHYLIQLLQLQRFELWLSQASPRTALLTFMVPVLLVTPINLVAIALIVHGLILQGIVLEIFAKLLGTLLIARVFSLTKNQLLTYSIISFVYHGVSGWLRWAHAKVAETKIYQFAQRLKLQVKLVVRDFFAK